VPQEQATHGFEMPRMPAANSGVIILIFTMDKKGYYTILNVSPQSTTDEIKASFRSLALVPFNI
jgi:hypothetical protein